MDRGLMGLAMTGAMRTCGVRVDAVDLRRAVQTVLERARAHRPMAVHLCNAYTLSLAVRDTDFARVVDAGDLNLMDGAPLVWTARSLGFEHCRERVYGPDLMLDVLDAGRTHGLRHYLYGSTPPVIERLRELLPTRLPGLRLVGAESPPFRPLTDEEEDGVVDRIGRSGADVVWVGLGTPKQDVFVHDFRDRIGVPLVAVGAAFDFHAGTRRQAPRSLQRAGLEWAFRLATEPRRLWRRYLVGNPVFLYGLMQGVERIPANGKDPQPRQL